MMRILILHTRCNKKVDIYVKNVIIKSINICIKNVLTVFPYL